MKRKEEKKAKQGRLKIRVVLSAGVAGLLGAACSSPAAPSVYASPCQGCELNPDGGQDGGVDGGRDAGNDGGPDGGDGG
jgi:hypothetical protein